jgi:hypothetical protein
MSEVSNGQCMLAGGFRLTSNGLILGRGNRSETAAEEAELRIEHAHAQRVASPSRQPRSDEGVILLLGLARLSVAERVRSGSGIPTGQFGCFLECPKKELLASIGRVPETLGCDCWAKALARAAP